MEGTASALACRSLEDSDARRYCRHRLEEVFDRAEGVSGYAVLVNLVYRCGEGCVPLHVHNLPLVVFDLLLNVLESLEDAL